MATKLIEVYNFRNENSILSDRIIVLNVDMPMAREKINEFKPGSRDYRVACFCNMINANSMEELEMYAKKIYDEERYIQLVRRYKVMIGINGIPRRGIQKYYDDLLDARADGKIEGIDEGRVEGEKIGYANGEKIGRAEGEIIGRAEGELIGVSKGENKATEKIAKNLLGLGMSPESIARATGLAISKIHML